MLHLKTMQSYLLLVLAMALSQSNAAPAAAADWPQLMKHVPGETNILVLIDAERLYASPMAKRDGWQKKKAAEYVANPLVFPPKATKVIRAAHFDIEGNGRLWEVALVEMPTAISLTKVAKHEKGYLDTVSGTKAVWSPRGMYVTQLEKNVAGLLFPSNRQYLSRWTKQKLGTLANDLLATGDLMTATSPEVLLAIHLEDSLAPDRLRAALKNSPAVSAADMDPEATAEILEGLNLATLQVSFSEKATGVITLTFKTDPAKLLPVASQLLIEALDQKGASLDELADWKAHNSGNTLVFRGDLGKSSLLRLGSLMDLPSISLNEDAEPDVDATKPEMYATQAHFKSVDNLLEDLLDKKREAKTIAQVATWVDQYAKKIDRLPLVQVDPDMQKYSADVAETLHEISSAIKGVGIRTAGRSAQVNSSNSGNYGNGAYNTGFNYDGYNGNRAVSDERRAIKASERATGALTTQELVNQLKEDTAQIRRVMTERYQVEF